jgi:hypothetical protein
MPRPSRKNGAGTAGISGREVSFILRPFLLASRQGPLLSRFGEAQSPWSRQYCLHRLHRQGSACRSAAGMDKSEASPVFFVEPRGQGPWHLTNAHVGRHPGQRFAHSSTARGRGFLLPGKRTFPF